MSETHRFALGWFLLLLGVSGVVYHVSRQPTLPHALLSGSVAVALLGALVIDPRAMRTALRTLFRLPLTKDGEHGEIG